MPALLAQLDPTIWAAILVLIGVLVGHLTSAWGKKRDQDLATVKLTVDVLQTQVDGLREEVEGLRAEVREAEKRTRIVSEHLSAALAFVRVLMIRLLAANDLLRAHDLDPVPVPEVPELIVADMAPTA